MADNDQERTEQPTSRKREQAREQGNVATSKEISTLFTIVGAVLVLYFASVWIATGLMDFMRKVYVNIGRDLGIQDVIALSRTVAYDYMLIMAPLLLVPVFGALSYILQNGFMLTGKPLTPDISKINPLQGAKKIFSLNAVAELVKSLMKVGIISFVAYTTVKKEWTGLPLLVDMETAPAVIFIAKTTFSILMKTVWVLLVISLLDYIYQKWQHEKGLRMTKEEIKEENKQTEGDPMVKARIKSIQRDIATKRMMQDVPDADVVLTNPTHYAVALKYDRAEADAPTVVAKGKGTIAEKIKELAREHGVPVVENKPLARGLYKQVEIGMQIPFSMYKAVAEVLAYVYKLKDRRRRARS